MFIPVQSFVHGDDENEIYWFHPDHLGSTSYISNILGEVSQHMEYFAFGETFVEEHRSSNNSPYKFNGKELDEETGWYYYGARYYDPRISVWLSVDPLASYDPIQNSEHYIDGQHNGGVFNPMNLNVYGYTYQNPLRYIDPNGKQVESEVLTLPTEPNPTRPSKISPRGNPSPSTGRPIEFPNSNPQVKNSPGMKPGFLATRVLPLLLLLAPTTAHAPAPKSDVVFLTNIDPEPKNDNNGMTLYRGVSSDYTTRRSREMYKNAKLGIAIPLGLEGGHDDMELHSMGNNFSVFTSWTTDKKTAEKFARGLDGKFPGVILSKDFKVGEAIPNTSPTAQRLNEGEWLVPGVVKGAKVENLTK